MTCDEPDEPRDTSYYDDDAYDESEHLKSCQALWAAVIGQAISDAINPDDGSLCPVPRGKNSMRRRVSISAGVTARRWIAGGTEYFEVCHLAGVSHKLIRDAVAIEVKRRNIRAAEMDEQI